MSRCFLIERHRFQQLRLQQQQQVASWINPRALRVIEQYQLIYLIKQVIINPLASLNWLVVKTLIIRHQIS